MAGTVLAVGAGVQRWRGGERVISTFVAGWLDGAAPASSTTLGVPGPGVLASHVLLDADWVVVAPATLGWAQASTLPCAALTAWFALIEEGGLRAGQTVLIHGTGGVALFGLQFARLHGAQVVSTRPGNPSCRHCREGSQSRRWSDAIQSGTSKVEVASTAAASTVVALDCQFQGSISSRSRMRAVGRRPRISVK